MLKLALSITVLVLATCISLPAFAGFKCKDFEPALCFQMHAPSKCVSLSVGGEILKRPILADGVNRCFATNALRKKACDKGLDWRELADEEVHCVLLP